MIAVKSRRRSSAPIKWHGGKHYLAERIVQLMPDHTHYVEPFFGGGAVLFRKPSEMVEGHSEVVNDLFGDLANFWQVLQSEELFERFHRKATMTPFSKTEFNKACGADSRDPLERAWSFFVRFRQSRQGLGRDFATMSRKRTRRGMNEQVSSWLSAIEDLPDAHERLQRVVIYCEPAVDVIRREDDRETLFYCDPPYISETRTAKKAYSCEMSNDAHRELLDTLTSIEGRFMLSGYRHPLYDAMANVNEWRRIDIQIDNKASSQKKKPKKTECVWMNY